MKKLGIILFTAALAAQAAVCTAAAEESSVKVRVTIGNAGELVLPCEEITVYDRDGDGKYTIDEALYAAHESAYEGGAAAGYATQNTDWGLSLKTLWGVTNGGSYGYAVNDVMSMGLTDQLHEGDYLSAYSFQDTTGFSDHYAYFDVRSLPDVKQGDTVTLKLTEIAYTPDWQQELKPVPNAAITIDGTETAFKTDADGKVDVRLEKEGEQVISFKADHPLSPVALRANVQKAEESVTTQPPVETTAEPDTTTAADTTSPAATTAADTTTAAASTTTAGATASSKAGASNATTKAGAANTGDTNAVPALAVTLLTAFGGALALRRRSDK